MILYVTHPKQNKIPLQMRAGAPELRLAAAAPDENTAAYMSMAQCSTRVHWSAWKGVL